MNIKRKLIAGVVAALAVAGGGAAIASTQLNSPKEESQAIVNDAAQQLGIQPGKLSAALKQAYKNRVDAAVEAGRITKEDGAAIKERIDAEGFPLLGVHPRKFGHHEHGRFGAKLDAAATYLGLTEAELRTQIESGKSLADIAKAEGKSVDGLIQALYDAAKEKLDAAVAAGKLTKAQETKMLADLKERLTDLVNGKFPAPPALGDRHFGGPRLHFRGAPNVAGPPVFVPPSA